MSLGPVSSQELSLATSLALERKVCRGSEGREVLHAMLQTVIELLYLLTVVIQ